MITVKSKMRMGLGAAFIGFAMLSGAPGAATAAPVELAPLATLSKQAQSSPAAEKVHYRGGLRRECASRWGWNTRGFYRCLGRHSYRPVRNYCRATRHECADRWGWRNWRYHRCVRNRGC
jgi:hypothetical protein